MPGIPSTLNMVQTPTVPLGTAGTSNIPSTPGPPKCPEIGKLYFILTPSLSKKTYFVKCCYQIPDRGTRLHFRNNLKDTFAVIVNYFFL